MPQEHISDRQDLEIRLRIYNTVAELESQKYDNQRLAKAQYFDYFLEKDFTANDMHEILKDTISRIEYQFYNKLQQTTTNYNMEG